MKFQYPLRVKWILQLSIRVQPCLLQFGFSTLYGSSGFFNTKKEAPVDANNQFQYPLRVKWILQPGFTFGRYNASDSFSTLYGSSGFFNAVTSGSLPRWSECFSTLYGSSGFFNTLIKLALVRSQ